MSLYDRDTLARVAKDLRTLSERLEMCERLHDDPAEFDFRVEKPALEIAAHFLDETVAVLDLQTKRRRDKAARAIIEKRRARRRRQR